MKAARTRSRWTRSDFNTDPVSLARSLIGQRLVHITPGGKRVAGLIVETEAYLGIKDLAAHSAGGRRTPRNEVMYGRPGLAYVFFTYGMHHCFNVVCGDEDEPVAVLIRALEPTEGLDLMRRRRARRNGNPTTKIAAESLCSGPARLCQSLAINMRHNGFDLATSSHLLIERADSAQRQPHRVVASPRIGVDYAGPWATKPLRWHVMNNPHVSR